MSAPRGLSARSRGLALLAGALLAARLMPSQAQEPKDPPAGAGLTFELELWKAPKSKVTATQFRPNTDRKFQLFVRNPSKNNQDLVVTVFDGPDSRVPLATIPLGNVPAGERVAVAVPKLGQVAAPVPAPDAKGDPKAAPAPAVKPLPLPEGRLTFRLAEKNGQVEFGKENAGKLVTNYSFTTAAPAAYLKPSGTLTAGTLSVALAIDAKDVVLEGKTTVDLVIPPQGGVRLPLPPGVYRRELADAEGTASLLARGIRLNELKGGGQPSFSYYLTVDGVPRAFAYVAKPVTGTAPVAVTDTPDAAVRVLPLTGRRVGSTIYALPADKFRVRLEADSAPSEARLDLQINRLGTGEAFDPVANFDAVRESRYALTPTEDGSLMVSNLTGDREVDVDVRGLRGTIILRANLLGAKAEAGDLTVVLDDTKPEVIPDPNAQIGKKEPPLVRVLVKRIEKGKTLAVQAFAQDSESGVASAFFFTGDAPADGVFPPDFKKVVAKLESTGPGVYKATAQLPIPTDTTGVQVIGVAFVNQVGLAGSEVQQIELIDPKDAPKDAADANPALATGTIKGEVAVGEVPQPNLPFVLTDAAGAQKFYKTDANGRFKIEKVLVGSYKVSAAKPDASFGTKGEQGVTVEKDKTAAVEVKLTRTGK